ncbi:MAG: hypothetical protein ACRDSL_04420 [Pseudonocardiaceae bacterium]
MTGPVLNWPTLRLDGRVMQFREHGGPYPTDEAGIEWIVTKLDGWFSSPAPTTAQTPRLAGHGSYRSPSRRPGRTIAIEFVATAPTAEAMRLLERQVTAWCSDPDRLYPLEVTEDAMGALTADVELSDEILTLARTDHSSTFSAQFRAPDPRLYGPWGTAGCRLFTGGTGGMNMSDPGTNMSDPGADLGDPGEQGATTITSAGTAPAGVVVEIVGPVTEPSVYVSELAVRLSWAGELAAGQRLYVNTGDHAATPPGGPTVPARSTLLDGQSQDHLLALDGGWPVLPAGVSRWLFTAGSYDPEAVLMIHARTGWW